MHASRSRVANTAGCNIYGRELQDLLAHGMSEAREAYPDLLSLRAPAARLHTLLVTIASSTLAFNPLNWCLDLNLH